MVQRAHRWSVPIHHPTPQRFIFATGIECSYPTIKTPDGIRRIDQLEKCGHYKHWRTDFQLTRSLGIRHLRYGPPYYRIHTGPGKFDWSFTDEVLPELRRMGILPILDMCHFGVPDWIENFQNPDFPEHFAQYARAFVERYPWIWCYTPVNEMYITAEFSAFYGWWNERLASDTAFVTALKHVAKAAMLAMKEILEVRPDAVFVLAESSEHTHADRPSCAAQAEMFNERRFLSMDLLCGHRISSSMYEYLLDNKMTEDELHFFQRYDFTEHFIMGNDYYESNEHLLKEDGTREFLGDIYGYYVLATHYFERYRLPVMHTETHIARVEEAPLWLRRTWMNIQQLRHDGIPVCGMTWYSLTDQMDWDTALREENNRVHPVGLFDLDRNIRPVGEAYKKVIDHWREAPLLPNGPFILVGDWAPASDGREPAATNAETARQAGSFQPTAGHPRHAP